MRLYDALLSGNAYKVRLLMAQLALGGERVEVDIFAGGARTPEFLARNAMAQVPVLEVEPGVFLAESNAILCYLAEGTPFLPAERIARALVLRWLFFEQNQHEHGLAVARSLLRFAPQPDPRAVKAAQRRGERALGVMESHLGKHPFFGNDRYTIADVSLYAYTHLADEGGFSLEGFPAVRAWLERVRTQPRHIPMERPYP